MENVLDAIEAVLNSIVKEYGSPQVIEQTHVFRSIEYVYMVVTGSINVNGSTTYYKGADSVSDIFENAKLRIEWADRTKDENKTEAP